MTLILPPALQPIIASLIEHRIKPVLVGGYLRDLLLNKTQSKDIDIELYGVDDMQQLITLLTPFSKPHEVGKSFGVLKVSYQGYEIDFSLPRSESKIADGHRGFQVTTYHTIRFKHAAMRRDFTINAMGFDLENNLFLDPYHGKDDLENKILRCVTPKSFVQDPLRLFRAVGFCARFELTCKDALIVLCQQMVQDGALHTLPKERIFEELKKLLLRSKKPSIGFRLMIEMKALAFFPQLESLYQQQHVFDDTLLMLDHLAQSPLSDNTLKLRLLFAVLVLRFKSETDVIDFITSLSEEKKFLETIVMLYRAYQRLCDLEFDDASIRRLALHVNIESLCKIAAIDTDPKIRTISHKLLKQAKRLHVNINPPKALLQGRDLIALGIKPSEAFSQLLERCFDAQLDGEFYTLEEAKIWLAHTITKNQ